MPSPIKSVFPSPFGVIGNYFSSYEPNNMLVQLLEQYRQIKRNRFETPEERDARYDMTGLWK